MSQKMNQLKKILNVRDLFSILRKRNNKPQIGKFHTLVGELTTLTGDIIAEDSSQSIRVDGTLKGNIKITGPKSTIFISSSGKVFATASFSTANLEADHVIINGEVSCSRIFARETLLIESSAKITTEKIIYGGSLEIKKGAMITGYIRDGEIE